RQQETLYHYPNPHSQESSFGHRLWKEKHSRHWFRQRYQPPRWQGHRQERFLSLNRPLSNLYHHLSNDRDYRFESRQIDPNQKRQETRQKYLLGLIRFQSSSCLHWLIKKGRHN